MRFKVRNLYEIDLFAIVVPHRKLVIHVDCCSYRSFVTSHLQGKWRHACFVSRLSLLRIHLVQACSCQNFFTKACVDLACTYTTFMCHAQSWTWLTSNFKIKFNVYVITWIYIMWNMIWSLWGLGRDFNSSFGELLGKTLKTYYF